MFKKSMMAITCFTALLALSSCGGGSVGSATSLNQSLDSDVAKGTNGQTNCSSPTITPDSVTFDISTLSTPSQTQVTIDSATITFEPANALSKSYIVPQQFVVVNQTLTLGQGITLPIRVVSQEMKNQPPLSNLVCTNTILTYYARVHFTAHATNSPGMDIPINDAILNVRFADFID